MERMDGGSRADEALSVIRLGHLGENSKTCSFISSVVASLSYFCRSSK